MAESIDRAVRRQRVADVPLGVLFSAGVDSPLVAAVARIRSGPGLKAFTIANPGWRQDEAPDAARLAAALQVDHRVEPITATNALEMLADVAACQHEPFAVFFILPTLRVSEFARREVTVVLSGDGGDELFIGYERPLSLLRDWRAFQWPLPLRRLYYAGRLGIGRRRSCAIFASSHGAYYFGVNCRTSEADLLALAPTLDGLLPEGFDLYADRESSIRSADQLARWSRRYEYYGHLQRTLKKVDMASMHHSLEVRLPLLDREVIETSLRIAPAEHMAVKGRHRTRKAILAGLLRERVPDNLMQQGKHGFASPLGEWLRTDLYEPVRQRLLDAPLWPDGVFSRAAIEELLGAHVRQERDAKWVIWTLLSLQLWATANISANRSVVD